MLLEINRIATFLSFDFASRLLGQAALLMLARRVGPAEYGAYGAALAIFSIGIVISDLGIGEASVQRLTNTKNGGAQYLAEVFTLRIYIGVGTFAVLALPIALLDPNEAPVNLLLLAGLPAASAVSGLSQLGRINLQFKSAAGWTSTLLLCQWVGGLVGSVIHPSALFASLGCFVSIYVVALTAAARLCPSGWPGRAVAEQWLRHGMPFGVTALAIATYSRGDRLVLAGMSGNVQTGLYVSAYSLVMLVAVGGSAIQASLLPRMLEQFERGSTVRLRGLGLVAAAGLALMLLTNAFAGTLVVALFGAEYSSASAMLRILSPLAALYLLSPFLATVLIATRQERKVTQVALINLALAIPLYPLLIWKHDATGAAFASVIIEAVGVCQYAFVLVRLRRGSLDAQP